MKKRQVICYKDKQFVITMKGLDFYNLHFIAFSLVTMIIFGKTALKRRCKSKYNIMQMDIALPKQFGIFISKQRMYLNYKIILNNENVYDDPQQFSQGY
jgi:hypothetical protein